MLRARIGAEDYEALPEALRGFYVKAAEDQFVLDVDVLGDVERLKGALKKERDAREAAEKAARDAAARFADLDPDKAREALKKLDELENKSLLDAGKLDEVVAKRTETMRKDYELKLANAQKAAEDAARTVGELTRKLETLTIDSALKELAVKAGVRDTALPDLLARGRAVFKMKDGQVVPLNEDGTTVLGKNGRDPLTFEEFVARLQTTDAPHLFEANRGSGASHEGVAATRGGAVVFRVPADGPVRLADFERAAEQAAKIGAPLAVER